MTINKERRFYLQTLATLGTAALSMSNSHTAHAIAKNSSSRTLNILNARSYIADDTLSEFRQQHNHSIHMDTYRSQTDLLSLLLSRSPKYDVVIIPTFLANRLYSANLLTPLKHAQIPNIKHLDTQLMPSDFDPERQFSLPYLWSIMGVGYRTPTVKGELDSWQNVFDSQRYSKRIVLHPNAKILLKCVLKYLGHQGPTTARALKEAEKLLIKQKRHIHFLSNAELQNALLDSKNAIAMGWNGYILQNIKKNKRIRYMTPKEGSLIWEDCLCIPRRAPNQQAAHAFINFVLKPEIAANIAQQTRYATPNKTALTLLPKSYTQNSAIFPSNDILQRSEILLDEGHYVNKLYQASLQRVMDA